MSPAFMRTVGFVFAALMLQYASATMTMTLTAGYASRVEELTVDVADSDGPMAAYVVCAWWPLASAPNNPTFADIDAATTKFEKSVSSPLISTAVTFKPLPAGFHRLACYLKDDFDQVMAQTFLNSALALPKFSLEGDTTGMEGGFKILVKRTDGLDWTTDNGLVACGVKLEAISMPTTQADLQTWFGQTQTITTELVTRFGAFFVQSAENIPVHEFEFKGLQGLKSYAVYCGLRVASNGAYYSPLQTINVTTLATTPNMWVLNGLGKLTVTLTRKDFMNFAGDTEDEVICVVKKYATPSALPTTINGLLAVTTEWTPRGGFRVNRTLDSTTGVVRVVFQQMEAIKWDVACSFAAKNGGGVVSSRTHPDGINGFQVNQVSPLSSVTNQVLNRTAFTVTVELPGNTSPDPETNSHGQVRCDIFSPETSTNINWSFLWTYADSWDGSVKVQTLEAMSRTVTFVFTDLTFGSRWSVFCGFANSDFIRQFTTDNDAVKLPCFPGKGAGSNGICSACEAGKYSLGQTQGQAPCTACPTGKTTASTGANATEMCCGSGASYNAASNTCVCPTAQVMTADGSCMLCPNNTYLASGACVTCPEGSNSTSGAVSVTQCICQVGREFRNNACALCEAGKFRKTASSNTNCTWCPEDTYSPLPGRDTECLKCPEQTLGGYERTQLAPTTCFCPRSKADNTMEWLPIADLKPTSSCITKYSGAHTTASLHSGLLVLLAFCASMMMVMTHW